MWSPVIWKTRSMNLRFGSEEFSRKNTSAVARPHKTRSTSRNCLKKVIIMTIEHHEIVQVKRRADGTSKWFGFVTFTSRKAAEQVHIWASNRSFNMVELAIMIQVFATPSHEIDGRIVELRRATSQVGVSILSSGFLWLPIIYHITSSNHSGIQLWRVNNANGPWSIGYEETAFVGPDSGNIFLHKNAGAQCKRTSGVRVTKSGILSTSWQ